MGKKLQFTTIDSFYLACVKKQGELRRDEIALRADFKAKKEMLTTDYENRVSSARFELEKAIDGNNKSLSQSINKQIGILKADFEQDMNTLKSAFDKENKTIKTSARDNVRVFCLDGDDNIELYVAYKNYIMDGKVNDYKNAIAKFLEKIGIESDNDTAVKWLANTILRYIGVKKSSNTHFNETNKRIAILSKDAYYDMFTSCFHDLLMDKGIIVD